MTTPAVETPGLPSDAPKPAPAAPVPGSPEYNAAMAAKLDGANGAPAVAQRPEGIPEKFWDAEKGAIRTEDLLKSYVELEKARGQVPPKEAQAAPAETPSTEEAAALAESKGLDFSKYTTEFQANGALSPESFAEIEKAGIPKPMVDSFIEGQMALAERRDAAGYEAAGGKENFAKIAAWAAQALPVADRVAFNEAAAGSIEQAKLAIMGLRAQYEAANGRTPNLVGGSPAPGSTGYESKAQMTADMRDPRYSKDPAFRAKVMAKIAASPF
jgi:hypothetical protein